MEQVPAPSFQLATHSWKVWHPEKMLTIYNWSQVRDKSPSLHKKSLTDQKPRRGGKAAFQCLFGNSLNQKDSAVNFHILQMQVCFAKKGLDPQLRSHIDENIFRFFPFPLGNLQGFWSSHQIYFFSALAVSPLSSKHSFCTFRLLGEAKT